MRNFGKHRAFKAMCYLPRTAWISMDLLHIFLFSVTCSIWHERQQNWSTRKSAQNSDETQRWLEKCSNQQLFELSKNCTNLSHRNAFFACGTLLELDATSSSSLSIIIMEMLSILVSIYFGHFSNWNLTCSSISIGFFFCFFLFRYHLVISVSFHLAWCVSDGCVLDFMPSVLGINLFAIHAHSWQVGEMPFSIHARNELWSKAFNLKFDRRTIGKNISQSSSTSFPILMLSTLIPFESKRKE